MNFKELFSFFSLLFFLSPLALAEVAIEGETEYVRLIQGVYLDKKFEDLPDESVFKYEDTRFKKFVDVVYDNDRKIMRFRPKQKGGATIRIVNKKDPQLILKQIRVSIQEKKLDQISEEVKSLLREIEGIDIKIINDMVVVDGYILLPKDLDRIAKVMSIYPPGTIKSLVRLSPLTKKKIAERIEAEIDNPNIYVTVINDFFMLEGMESYKGEKQRAFEIAQAHVADKISKFAESKNPTETVLLPVLKSESTIINNIRELQPQAAPPPKLIQFVIHYVELSKSYSKGFNFSWAPSIDSAGTQIQMQSDDLSSANIVTSLTATISNLLPKLNWAREHGHARVLDTMNLTLEEKKTGTVNSQRTITAFRSTSLGALQPVVVTPKVATTITNPEVDPQKPDNIKMQVKVQVGEVLQANSQGSDVSQNEVNTFLTIRDKQSAAIAGLMRSSSTTDYNRDPASSGGTPLFRLAASKSLARQQNQFVVFVTPFIKRNASEGIEKIKKKFRLDK